MEWLQIIIELMTPYVFWPAVPVIIGVVTFLSKFQIFDWGKMRWTLAIILGVIFGVVQKYGAPLIGRDPIQVEWIPAIIMGLSTGLLATGGYSAYKNWKENKRKNR